ncbi:minor tail protein [Microbacterium phage Zooman]|nr:minor tail protein [Microbacterium phage Zooman]
MPKQQTIAPVYRYFTVDLLTNEILTEVPLRGVSYACALKAGGKFSGKIPVTAETFSMDLYNSTMPGNTAIYVVRNGKAVWGGIIWSRSYDFDSKDLQISASEFTSYFYHRKIWKTWNHQYGGTLGYSAANGWQLSFDYGSNILAKGGSTVHIEFYEPSNFKYNGYYRVADTPMPTKSGFSLLSGFAVADLASLRIDGNIMTLYTKENHGYNTGDAIRFNITGDPEYPSLSLVGEADSVITGSGGPASNWFQVTLASSLTRALAPVQGYASRPLPEGTYEDVTVTVRQDAYDYVRSLIDSMFNDYVGTDFPNIYIEPGISWALPVVSKQAIAGYSIIETATPHGIAPGQAIQVQDVGGSFNGEFMVTDTPSPNVVVYEAGGDTPYTNVSNLTATITNIMMTNGLVIATTSGAHGLTPGQNVTVSIGDPYGDFSGTFVITETPTTTTFRYNTGLNRSYSSTGLTTATAASSAFSTKEIKRVEAGNGFFTVELEGPVPTAAIGSTATIANTDRDLTISEKALDAPNGKASVKTTEDHGLTVGDTVVISGLIDAANVVAKSTTLTSVTMTTERPHNLRAGESVSIEGTDEFRIISRSLTSNVVTLTTAQNHTIPVATTIAVKDVIDSFTVAHRSLVNNVATVSTTAAHNLSVNDSIFIDGLTDTYSVVSKEAVNGLVILTTSRPHNVLVGSKIKVSGVGMPFDSGEVIVDNVTATRITYKIDSTYWDAQKQAAARKGQTLNVPTNVPSSKATGTITAVSSFFNGQFTISAVPTTTTVQFSMSGEDQPSTAATGTNPRLSASSAVNGTYVVTGRTANTLTYARTGSNMASATIPGPVNAEDPVALVTMNSVHRGAKTISSVTANTFTFPQTIVAATSVSVKLLARKASIFNGTRTVTEVPTTDRFIFSLPGYAGNVFEESQTNPSFLRVTNLYNGTYTISGVNTTLNTVRLTKAGMKPFGSKPVLSRGRAVVSPAVIISSFGPFPANADLGMEFASRSFIGINLEPIAYRGFELKSVGEALDAYSDNINGFEYRIDVEFDEENNVFNKKFVMIPINFPDAPPAGTVAPLTRYGAEKLVFEYPGGNITTVQIDESAEESATRFFAVGETDLGPDAGPNIGVASSDDLLTGKNGRKWPLLDASETVSGVDNKDELHAYAKRYLSEAAPPYTTLSVSLNGSIAPLVGDYHPGDWCSLILDDPFMKMRLGTELEPRSDVFVRKISSYQVNVPDGVTFPETVRLNLVAEWEVDKRGE